MLCQSAYDSTAGVKYAKRPSDVTLMGPGDTVQEGVGEIADVSSGNCGRWNCPWDNENFATVEPRETVFEMDDLARWIDDVKKIVQLDMGGGKKNGDPNT
jgi:hypothetical protein